MSKPGLTYSVQDRSILLPFYKRFVIEPTVPLIPRRVDPNLITHVGHAANLAAVAALAAFGGPRGGWPFAVAAALLHFYNYCDNADGAHARRTGQCSAMGELLDHGLDLLNVAYIAAMTAMAVGASPLWSVAVMILIPAAAAATYWEQAETGVFELGLLNQVESITILSAALIASAIFGTDVWTRVHLGPVALREIALVVVCAGTAASVARTFTRVVAKRGAALPFAPLVLLGAGTFAAAATGALAAPAAIAIATSGLVFFGMRSLSLRVRGKKPLFERGVFVVATGALALAGLAALGRALPPSVGLAFTIGASGFFAALAVVAAGRSLRAALRHDPARRG